MTIRPIVQSGAPVLAGPIAAVAVVDAEVSQIIQDLRDTLHAHKIAVGLAAPQIGVPLKVAVINLKTPDFKDLILVNPMVISESGKRDKKKESCMSLRDKRGDVSRRENIVVDYIDEFGNEHQIKATKFLARVLAHEIDHLNGLLYTSRMSPDGALETVDFDAWESEASHGPSKAN